MTKKNGKKKAEEVSVPSPGSLKSEVVEPKKEEQKEIDRSSRNLIPRPLHMLCEEGNCRLHDRSLRKISDDLRLMIFLFCILLGAIIPLLVILSAPSGSFPFGVEKTWRLYSSTRSWENISLADKCSSFLYVLGWCTAGFAAVAFAVIKLQQKSSITFFLLLSSLQVTVFCTLIRHWLWFGTGWTYAEWASPPEWIFYNPVVYSDPQLYHVIIPFSVCSLTTIAILSVFHYRRAYSLKDFEPFLRVRQTGNLGMVVSVILANFIGAFTYQLQFWICLYRPYYSQLGNFMPGDFLPFFFYVLVAVVAGATSGIVGTIPICLFWKKAQALTFAYFRLHGKEIVQEIKQCINRKEFGAAIGFFGIITAISSRFWKLIYDSLGVRGFVVHMILSCLALPLHVIISAGKIPHKKKVGIKIQLLRNFVTTLLALSMFMLLSFIAILAGFL